MYYIQLYAVITIKEVGPGVKIKTEAKLSKERPKSLPILVGLIKKISINNTFIRF